MRNLFESLILVIWVSSGIFSQSCNCFVTVDSTYSVVPMTQGIGADTGAPPNYRCNDCSSPPIALPFNFCFYGTEYNTVYINNKGNLSFIQPDFTFPSTGLPAGLDTLMLAVYWSDVDDVPSIFSDIYYKINPTNMVVQWNTVGWNTFDDDTYNNFQLIITNGSDTILPPGNNVSYCFEAMQWASSDSSGGNQSGFEGVPGYVGTNMGDGIHYAQIGEFDFQGNTFSNPWFIKNQVYWLDGQSFTFNACVTRDTIPPVIVNPDSCSEFDMCVGDTIYFNGFFLCAQQGQTASLSGSAPGLTDDTFAIIRAADSINQISGRLIASLSDTGTHIITLKATDNSTPPLSNSRLIKVTILNCNDSGLGINELKNKPCPIALFPNPNNGVFELGIGPDSYREGMKYSMEVYNVLGERVFSRFLISNSQFLIDLSSQPNGIYLYRVVTEDGSLLGEGKFVIQ